MRSAAVSARRRLDGSSPACPSQRPITYWRYRLIPDHILGEILSKRWIDNAIPVFVLIVVVADVRPLLIPDFFSLGSLTTLTRQLGEFGLVVLAMMIVMLAGGIDLSVGSTFALANIVALALLNVCGLPLWLSCHRCRLGVGRRWSGWSTASWSATCGCAPS